MGPHCQSQEDISGFVEFSDVQIVHKFGGVTPNLDYKVTIFYNVKCLKNSAK